MSNYIGIARDPTTGQIVQAEWLDDHFGTHLYGVAIGERVYRPEEVSVDPTELLAERNALRTQADALAEALGKLVDDIEACADKVDADMTAPMMTLLLFNLGVRARAALAAYREGRG